MAAELATKYVKSLLQLRFPTDKMLKEFHEVEGRDVDFYVVPNEYTIPESID